MKLFKNASRVPSISRALNYVEHTRDPNKPIKLKIKSYSNKKFQQAKTYCIILLRCCISNLQKKMKRKKEEKDETCVKYAKIEKRITKLDLPPELISEITGWLPPRSVVTVYSLVNKEWREAILNHSKLDLSMSMIEWYFFCQRPQEIVTAIDHLSIDHRPLLKFPNTADARLRKPDLSVISAMKRLESLSLFGVSMDKSVINLIMSVGSIKRVRLCLCILSRLDLEEFVSCRFALSIEQCDFSRYTQVQKCGSIEESHSVKECESGADGIDIQECARVISSIDNLERVDYTSLDELVARDSNQEAASETFYKSLFGRKNLSSVALFLNSQNSKYFSLLRNITELKITNQRLHMDDVPDLSGLIQLKKLTVGPFLSKMRMDREKSCLGAVLKQLTSLDIRHGVLTKDEWNNLDRLEFLSELSVHGMTLGKDWKRPSIRLTQLSLSRCLIREDILRSVTSLANLTSLSIEFLNVELLESGGCKRFEFPDLCYNDGSATKCDLIHLVRLDVDIPPNGSNSFCVLQDMPNLEKVTFRDHRSSFKWDYCGELDVSHFKHIASSKSIRDMRLVICMKPEYMRHISTMDKLASLSIHRSSISKDTARCISVMTNLKSLNLLGSNIDIKALPVITSMKNLTTLQLGIRKSAISEAPLYMKCLNSITSAKYIHLSVGAEDMHILRGTQEHWNRLNSHDIKPLPSTP